MIELPFREIWAVDFEFISDPGHRPIPVCLVARELRTRRLVRQWRSDMGPAPPYGTGAGSLFIAYYASAELGCHLALGWPLPSRVVDLFAEFALLTNGRSTPCGRSLLGALHITGSTESPVARKTRCGGKIVVGARGIAAHCMDAHDQ